MFTRKMLRVFAWEYVERLRSKAFVVSLLFLPSVILIFTVLPTYFAAADEDAPMTVAVADRTGFMLAALKDALTEEDELQPIRLVELNPNDWAAATANGLDLVRRGAVNGFLLLDDNVFTARGIDYYAKGIASPAAQTRLELALSRSILEHRLRQMHLDTSQIRNLTHPVRLQLNAVDDDEQKMVRKYIAGIVVVMMLFFAIFNSGGGFLRGLLEEKSSRIMEVLISSVSPRELMAGKILGLGCVGLTQVTVWTLLGALLGGSTVLSFLSPTVVCFLILYFVLGYLLFASVFSVMGSLLSSDQDVHQLQGVISLIGVLPIAFAFVVLKQPDTLLVNVLSYVPFLTPTLMILRLVISHPPVYHVVGSTIVLTVFLVLTLRAAGKIFQTALLLQGKRATLREIWTWYRAK